MAPSSRPAAADVVLVTGGGGFIGSHVVGALAAGGQRVRVLDVAPRPRALPGGVDYRQGDLTDPATVAAAVEGVGSVCHQAAKVGLEAGVADMAEYVRVNDTGTALLLRALDAAAFTGRLVLASSMVVYGEGGYRCQAHGTVRPGPRPVERLDRGQFEPTCPTCGAEVVPEAIGEDGALDPRNTYAATKLHQEHLCAAFARHRGVPFTALRYHNVYGPGMPRDTPYAGVTAVFADSLGRGQAPQVFEDGAQRRDFVHVTDVARANLVALLAPDPVPGAFNIASGRPGTVLEMARAVAGAFGPEAPEPVVTGRYRLGDVRHIVASPARAAEVLGFRATIGLLEGMAGLGGHSGPGPRP